MFVGNNSVINGSIDMRGRAGKVKVGDNCVIDGYIVSNRDESELVIGNNVFVGGQSLVDCSVSIHIEDDVLISYRCMVLDHDGHSLSYGMRKKDLENYRKNMHDWSPVKMAPVRICKGAWIGAASIILKGVTIGEGAVIGAGAVVTKSIPAWNVAAGNPARTIRCISDDER